MMRRVLPILAAALTCIGCAPAAQHSQVPYDASAVTATVSASVAAAPTPSATVEPSTTPVPTLHSDSRSSGRANIFEVVTTDLVMRSAPGTGPDSVIYTRSLSAPMLLYLLDGPVAADGYEWFRVVRFEEYFTDIGLPGPNTGWVAGGGQDGEPWIAPWKGVCPEPNASELLTRSPIVALACFGDLELTLEGTVGDCSDAGVGAPVFQRSCLLVPFGYQAQLPPGFGFYLATSISPVGRGEPVRVTGQHDHPAAPTCDDDITHLLDQTSPEAVLLSCRGAFVATEISPTSAP